jgi:SAM-dependent methyltransferase
MANPIAAAMCPTRFKYIRRLLSSSEALSILDVGCGNHSPTITKHWFPGCRYTGVDIAEYNLDDGDHLLMDRFVIVGADGAGYEQIEGESFDLIVMNHVMEHMADPYAVLERICRSLRPGGYIYLAFPSVRSLALPSACDTALNFCDDPTHIRIPDVRAVAQALLDNGVRVLRAGRSWDMPRYLVGAALYPCALVRRYFSGQMSGRGLWQFLGFEDMVLGQRRNGIN